MDLQTFLDDFMNSDDLRLLVRDVSALFECPAMVVDMAFHAVAWHCAEDFRDAPFQSSIRRGSLTYETGSILAGSDARPCFVRLDDSPHRRRFSPLVTGGVPVGYLILVDVGGTLERTDARLFSAVESALAKQLMLEVSRSGAIHTTEEAVLARLLEGGFADEALFDLQAEAAGLTHFAPRRLALANLELYRSANWTDNALRGTILDMFPRSRPLIHGGNVVFFLNSDPDLALFRSLSGQFNLRVVVSAPMRKLFDLPQICAGAQELMELLMPLMPGPFAVCAEDYQALMMLRHLQGRPDLALPSVRALAARDREEQTPYCLTLYTYICCHHSLQETCARLYTHRNTVLYRVRRMREDFDIPVDDPDQQLGLMLSAALMLMEQGREDVFMPKAGGGGNRN